jgi:hypothetical protein
MRVQSTKMSLILEGGTVTTDLNQTDLGAQAWELLHELRLRGFVPAKDSAHEAELVEAGLAMTRGQNLALTPAGRQAHARWARLPAGSPEGAAGLEAYRAFLPLNAQLLRICTDWQLRPDGSLNDHSDSAYDFKVLERLDRLDAHIAALVNKLAEAVPRFAAYPGRLTAALDRIADDRQWLASPRCDSYHTVWMQMHEDLLTAVGASREDEPEPE